MCRSTHAIIHTYTQTLPFLSRVNIYLMPKTVRYHDSDSDNEGPPSVATPADVIAAQRAQLPMFQSRKEVVDEIRSYPVTIIVGETGSGKSTQLPQALLEADKKQNIVVSQPRRVAAMSLGHRVAAEHGTPLGATVGYNVRFDAKVGKNTRIRYVTDGMLLREFMLDPHLSKYTTVVVDEAHERTVTSDLVLGLLKQLLEHRKPPKFRVIVMSATLDAERFATFFGDAVGQLFVPGRAFGVDRFYLKTPAPSIVDASAQAVAQINHSEPGGGDILVFLPGQDEIEAVADLLRTSPEHKPEKGAPKYRVVPLYASLPEKDQQLAFQPAGNRERKIVLATNIAETSVTIPGVRYVVDSGVRKARVHRSTLGLESLLPGPISQASAAQRMGRAGREGPGKCWRLYTEKTYSDDMQAQTEPEISRVNLAFPILLLKRIGVSDVVNFPWLDRPKKSAIRNALFQLFSLRALDGQGNITALGLQMATLPLDPRLSAVLVHATTNPAINDRVRDAVLDVAACLSVQDLLITPPAARRQEVNDNRQEIFPASVQYGDLVLVKLIWDTYQTLDRVELKDWCHAIGVSLRALRKVEQVRKQLVDYLKDARKGKTDQAKHNEPHGTQHQRFADDSDSDAEPDSDAEADNKLETEDYELLIKTFLTGYVTNTAIALPNRQFQTTTSQQPINIHPGSALFGARPEAIMFLEYVYTIRGYARFVSPISIEWLKEFAPHLLARATQSEQ